MKSLAAAAAAPPSVVISDEGEKKSINPELWQACAGPLVNLPAAGTHVVYFPQGHSEQVAASMKKNADAQIPNYPNLSSKLLCLLHNVTLHADPETDEVYAQMTLQPVPSFDKEALLRSELSLKVNKPQTEFFCKTLTASDTSTHGGFSVPRRAAEKIFPPLDFSMQPPAQELTARDLHENVFTFRHVFRGQPKRHLLTTGWSHFIGQKRLLAGDSVLFIRNEKKNLLLGLRRANRQPPNLSFSMLSSDSVHIGILAAAAHASASNSPFTVFYNPRASPSEFVIPLAKYYRAFYGQQISLGMRFRMQFETEESETRRHMGTITGISDLDPVRWKSSQWRNLQVNWDESASGDRRNRVSAWEIEPVIAPFFICPPFFGAKHPRQPDDDPSEFGNLFKRTMPFCDDNYMKEQRPYNGFTLAQQMNMGQNPYLTNTTHTNFPNPSSGFLPESLPFADVSHQLGILASHITQHNNLQFNVPRQMQPAQEPDQLQSSTIPTHVSSSGISQISQNLVNQNLAPNQVHSTMKMQNNTLQNTPSHQYSQNLVNHNLSPAQVHSTVQMQNTLQNTSSHQNSQLHSNIINQNAFQQPQPVIDENWQNCMVASNLPKQCNLLSQVTSNQTQLELLQTSSFQQPSQFTQIQNLQKHNVSQRYCNSLVSSEIGETQSQSQILAHQISRNSSENDLAFVKSHQMPNLQQQSAIIGKAMTCSTPSTNNIPNAVVNMGPQSSNGGDVTARSSAIALNPNGVATVATSSNSFKEFHQKTDIKPSVGVSKPPNGELIGQQTNQNVPGSHLDYLDTSSAASASLSQGDAHLNRNNSASFNSHSALLRESRDRSQCNENIDTQLMNSTLQEVSNISSGVLITNYENCNDSQQELSSSMVTHSFGIPDMAFNSIDSAMIHDAWGPPPQSQRIRTYTKVYKRGAVGRSVDVTRYSGYEELKQDLARRFGIVGQLEDRGRVGWKIVYVDHENDVLLLGDDPWEEFVRCVRCIKILSPQEVQQMSLDGEHANLSLPNQACSTSDGGHM